MALVQASCRSTALCGHWNVCDHLYKKSQSRLYFLRRLASNICTKPLQMFFNSVAAGVLFYAVEEEHPAAEQDHQEGGLHCGPKAGLHRGGDGAESTVQIQDNHEQWLPTTLFCFEPAQEHRQQQTAVTELLNNQICKVVCPSSNQTAQPWVRGEVGEGEGEE